MRSFMCTFCLVFICIQLFAMEAFSAILTEEEAAKIAFVDWLKNYGERLLADEKLRVAAVELTEVVYGVRLAVHNRVSGVTRDVALYYVDADDGRIVGRVHLDPHYADILFEGFDDIEIRVLEDIISNIRLIERTFSEFARGNLGRVLKSLEEKLKFSRIEMEASIFQAI